MVMICTTCPNWSVTGQCFLATLHIESVAHSGTVNIRTNGDELQHWIRSLPARICHRGRSVVQCLTDIIINFFLSLELGASLMLHKLLLKTLCFPPLGRLRQLVWDPDTCQKVTATSRASKWYQISHFMISLHYVYVYINIFVCLYSI